MDFFEALTCTRSSTTPDRGYRCTWDMCLDITLCFPNTNIQISTVVIIVRHHPAQFLLNFQDKKLPWQGMFLCVLCWQNRSKSTKFYEHILCKFWGVKKISIYQNLRFLGHFQYSNLNCCIVFPIFVCEADLEILMLFRVCVSLFVATLKVIMIGCWLDKWMSGWLND